MYIHSPALSLSLSLLDIFRERVINAIRFHSVGIQDGEQTIQSSLRKLAIRDGLKTSKKESCFSVFIHVKRKKIAFLTESKLFERVASLTMRLVFPRLPPPAGRYILF